MMVSQDEILAASERAEWPVGKTLSERAWKAAVEKETPTGKLHLHLLAERGRFVWVVRTHSSPLCGTARCRIVTIKPWESHYG